MAVCSDPPSPGVFARADCGRLRHAYPDNMQKQLSSETIYAALLPRGDLRTKLLAVLRQARKVRWPQSRGVDQRGQFSHIFRLSKKPCVSPNT